MFLALFLLVAKVCLYAVVQLLSRIVSHLLLTIVNGCGLYDDGQVSARTDRDVMADHLIAEKLRVAVLQAQPVVLFVLVPVLQLNDHVDILGIFYALNTVQGLHINDTDTSQLDEVLGDIRRTSYQSRVTDFADLYNIIGYKTMSALD